MSGDETVGQQQPPERPARETVDPDPVEAPPRERESERRETDQKGISLETGPRRTRNVETLKIEAAMVAEDGHRPDNPAQPLSSEIAEEFHEQCDHEPAWIRPWEDGDE